MSSFTTELKYEFIGTYSKGNPQYVVTEDFSYCLGSLETPVAIFTVPAGYITDFASVPWPFNLFLKPDGPWAKAAVLHDFLLEHRGDISKVFCDGVFLEGLLVLELSKFWSHFFFLFVRFYHEVLDPNRKKNA